MKSSFIGIRIFQIKLSAIVAALELITVSFLFGSEADEWSARPSSPAVVNPVLCSPLQQVISLRGEWEFATETSPRNPVSGKWKDSRTIQVPGCWEAQGVGEPGMSVCWDPIWDAGPRVLKHVFMGHGWYRKTMKIPESWKNQKVWLKVGGVRSQGWFWINGKRAAFVDNYCGTYKYDITDLVTPGSDTVITVKVRNDSPSRKGLFSWCHRFGGLYRDVEIEATPATRIDYAWVRGDFDRKLAIVNTTVCRNDLQISPKEINLQIELKTTDGLTAGKGIQKVVFDPNSNTSEVHCEIPLTEFQAWTPESPKLYYAEIVLRDGNKPVHGWMERFGVRKFEVRGGRFYFNNQPFFPRISCTRK